MQPARKISVLMPVRNESDVIEDCLQSVVAQIAQHDGELLVIDGMSEDGTREIVERYGETDPRVRLLDNRKLVVTTAINIGFQEARGDVILRMDAHADYAPDYIEKCLEVLEETGAGNVGGAARPASDGSFVGDLIKAVHESPFGIGAARFRQEDAEGWVDSVWPGAWRREALEQAGMYCREELTRSEDIELNSRLRKAGWGIYLSPKIKARYYPRKSLWALCKQNFANGTGVMHTLKAGLGGVSLRHLVPLGFVLALIGGLGASLLWDFGWWLLAALLIIYFGGALAFSAKAAWENRQPVMLPVLPIAFFALHLSYGLGSIAGLLTRPRAPSQ